MNMDLFMQNLNTGIVITLIGMIVVMIFLLVLTWVVDISGRVIMLINRFFPEEIPEPVNKKKVKKNTDEEAQIAISVAMAFDRQQKGV